MKLLKESAVEYSLKATKKDYKRAKISSSEDAYNFIKQFYQDDINIFESSFILLLNQQNNTIGHAKISQGGVTGTLIDIRLIAKFAIENLATSVLLAHNHPSGQLKPSSADIQLTKRISEGLKTLEITLLDHLILTDEYYTSLKDESYF